MIGLLHWLLHLTGIDDVSGPWYGFWSGFAGCIPMFGILAVLWRKHNCHVKGCWRIQWRTHGEHVLCRKHHPADPPTAESLSTPTQR